MNKNYITSQILRKDEEFEEKKKNVLGRKKTEKIINMPYSLQESEVKGEYLMYHIHIF